MKELPRITFGVIMLNEEPFMRYNLRSLYPFAHEMIVVEGASEKAATIATPDGHSTDGTLDLLHCFKEEEDPKNKITIATAEHNGHPSGFWPGEKDEQSRAYAKRATGNYLWQIDIDEFYKSEDIASVPFLILHGTSKPSWIKSYAGDCPEQVTLLESDLWETRNAIKQGNEEAITKLLSSNSYKFRGFILGVSEHISYRNSQLINRVWAILRFIKNFGMLLPPR